MIFTWPLWLIYGLRRRNRFVLRFYRPRSATGDVRWRYLSLYVFTCRSALPAPFGDSIFRCTAKDRGERRASSSQAPHPSFCLSGQKLSRSAAPPLPTKPTSLGFGGAPIGGPHWIPGVMFWMRGDVPASYEFAVMQLTRFRPVASSQTPYPSFCLSGQKLSHSVAPPFPTKPTSLGFGGAPFLHCFHGLDCTARTSAHS